jgi:hypothetical protein
MLFLDLIQILDLFWHMVEVREQDGPAESAKMVDLEEEDQVILLGNIHQHKTLEQDTLVLVTQVVLEETTQQTQMVMLDVGEAEVLEVLEVREILVHLEQIVLPMLMAEQADNMLQLEQILGMLLVAPDAPTPISTTVLLQLAALQLSNPQEQTLAAVAVVVGGQTLVEMVAQESL